MAAAPFMLTGIGAVVGVTILGAAGLFALHRHRRSDSERKEANAIMQDAEKRMAANVHRMKELAYRSRKESGQLTKAVGVLETIQTSAAVEQVGAALEAADQLFHELQKPLPYTRLYLGRPSPLPSLQSITSTQKTITLNWKDPDNGESEITGYQIRYKQGSFGEEKLLTSIQEQTLTHEYLTPGKTCHYKIIPINVIGEALKNQDFKAETNPA